MACVTAYREADEVHNARAGVIAASVRNAQRSSKKQKHWEWTDFFKPLKPIKRKKKTLDELRAGFYEFKEEKAGRAKKK